MMNRISRFASVLLTALQLPLFSSTVTYGEAKKLVNSARELVSPKKDKDNIKNEKSDKTDGKGQHKVDSVKRFGVRDKVKSVMNGVVDDFFDKPIESSLKYLGIPALCYGAFSIIKNEIYNCGHFPSRIKPELIIYLVENNFQKWPSKDELDTYCREHFSNGAYGGNINWRTKWEMMCYLAGILMTNYYLGGYWGVCRQIGYTIVDVLLFRNTRDRVSISAKRFLNNKSGSCFEIACYLLLFMESLGVEARLAFVGSKGVHTCLVCRMDREWVIFDPMWTLAKAEGWSGNNFARTDLLVLEKIERDERRKISEMRCAKIEKGYFITDMVLSNKESYTHDVPRWYKW